MDDITIYLVVAIGFYMFASGIGIARKPATAHKVLEELEASPALIIITGAFTYFLGATLIAIHNKWDNVLEGFVSFVGWSAAIQGLLLLAAPGLIFGFARIIAPGDKAAGLFGALTVAVGGGLLFLGIPLLITANAPV